MPPTTLTRNQNFQKSDFPNFSQCQYAKCAKNKLTIFFKYWSLLRAGVDCHLTSVAACLLCPPQSLRHGGCLIEKIISLNTNIFYHDLIYWKTLNLFIERKMLQLGKMCAAVYYWVTENHLRDEYLFTLIHLFPSGVGFDGWKVRVC